MKKSLLAMAAVLMATTSSFAMDVTHPFYIPMEGDYLSETNVGYYNIEHGRAENALLAETLSYGVTRNFTIDGTLADAWLFDTKGVVGHDRYDNPAFALGVKYNLLDCCKNKWKVQLAADYTQGISSLKRPLLSLMAIDHHTQVLSADVTVGYQLKGSFMPYVTVSGYKPIGDYERNPDYSARAALYKTFGKHVSADAGLTYLWSNATNGFGKHGSVWALDGALNYVFSDCMSVGLKGDYLMRTKPVDADAYSIGVNFKVAF